MPLTNYTYRDRIAEPDVRMARRDAPQSIVNSGSSIGISEKNLVVSLVETEDPVPLSSEWDLREDFEIALVPCGRLKRQRRSTTDRILLLPLTWRELLHRIRTSFDHCDVVDPSMVLTFGDVRVNFLTMEVCRSEEPVRLTAQEFKLLKFFSLQPHRVISRDELLNEVWGYTNYPSTRTVDNHVLMLRKKLEQNPADPVHFLTVHGVGYKFSP